MQGLQQLPRMLLARGWVNHTPTGATLVRLVFPLAAFHPVVLIDVADVEPTSTAHRVGRLPISGAVQYIIVGTAVERVGGSIPPEFVTSFAHQRKCLWHGLKAVEKTRRDGRLGETYATEGVRSAGALLGGGTLLWLDQPQPKDE